MKLIAFIFYIFLLFLVGFLSISNLSNYIAYEVFDTMYRINVGCLSIFSAMLGGFLVFFSKIFSSKKNDLSEKRILENEKLSNEIRNDKIKQLEAKIQTLESALKKSVGADH